MLNRREMLLGCATLALSKLPVISTAEDIPIRNGIPRVDYHVHIGGEISVDRAIEIAEQKQMKFGLLQHAGLKSQGFAITDNESLNAWVRSLEGKPVFKGIEAESVDWPSAFSKESLARLDYVQADPLGVPGKSGSPLQIWKPGFRPQGDVQSFMDRYAEFHVQRISTGRIHILAVPTYLPDTLVSDYDTLWTPKRMQIIVDAAVKKNVALEIESRFRVPRLNFLQIAKSAGAKFAFGSNYQTLDGIGDISYGLEMYKRLDLKPSQIFDPSKSA